TLDSSQIQLLKNREAFSLACDPAKDRCIRRFYNKDKQLIAIQNEAGYITEFKLNAAGWVKETIVYATLAAINWEISDFNKIRPAVNLHKDAHEYAYYNNRGLCELTVNSEGYITKSTFLA